jgi:Ca2+-binding EF-hand superfamily protein
MTTYTYLTSDDIQTLTEFFNFVDTDHDGLITINEIKEVCAVDINADGVISEDEILLSASPWIDNMLINQDLDHDSKLSLEELLKYNDIPK